MQCAQAFRKARSALFLIMRSFVTLPSNSFIPLYSTFVRPHLEYAIQASSPYLKKDVDHLERLQRLATRMVKGCRYLSFEERLEKLIYFRWHVEDWEVIWSLRITYRTAPWIYRLIILHSATLFQPSRVLLETESQAFPVEPKEGRLLRSNGWALEQATCICCRSSNC